MSKQGAIKALGIILSSFPSGNREGIENFYRMAVESLSKYPDRVLEELADPNLGIVTKSTFIPSIAEMRSFCDRAWDRLDPPTQIDRAPDPLMLGGPAKDPEAEAAQRTRIIQGFKDLLAELKSVPDPTRPNQTAPKSKVEEKAEAEAWLEGQAERAKTDPLPKLSESALKAFHNSLSGRTI